MLEKLNARKITGNEARETVTRLLSHFTEESAKCVALIIDKDLQAGFSAETFNKIWPDDKIPVFDVMLADKCTTEEEFENLNFPCLADIKYDGERNIAVVEEGKPVVYYSRSGKVAEHMNGLFDHELGLIRQYLGYDFVLDGERMARDYIETINAKKSGKDGEAAKANMIFRAFFLMPLTDWLAKKTTLTMGQNREFLSKLLMQHNIRLGEAGAGPSKIILSDSVIVNSYSEMMRELDRVTTHGFQGMPNGQEGLILKQLNATYQWDRSLAWCKVKKFYDVDMKAVSWEYGKKKNANVMGRVNFVGFLEDGTRVECGVGSGWSDEQRKDVAENWEQNWEGRVCVIKYQEVSKAKNATVHSLRFPTFERGPRDDKDFEI